MMNSQIEFFVESLFEFSGLYSRGSRTLGVEVRVRVSRSSQRLCVCVVIQRQEDKRESEFQKRK